MLSTIPYFGGKQKLAEKLIARLTEIMEDHKLQTFIDVCGGSGRIAINMPQQYKRHYNDIDPGLCALMQTFQNESKLAQMLDLLETIPYTEESFTAAKDKRANEKTPKIKKAAYTYLCARQSILSQMKHFNTDESKAIPYYTGLKNAWQAHLGMGEISVTNKDWLDILSNHFTDKKALLFLDPPYTKGSNAYIYHPPTADYDKLINEYLLNPALKAKVVICTNDPDFFKSLTDRSWQTELVSEINRTSAQRRNGISRSPTAYEYIITNEKTNPFPGQ